jgi:hypothetical protein
MNVGEPIHDKEKVWDEEIFPLVKQVYDLCEKHNIHFFSAACVLTTTKGRKMAATCFKPQDSELQHPDLDICSAIVTQEAKAMRMKMPKELRELVEGLGDLLGEQLDTGDVDGTPKPPKSSMH